MWQEQKQTATSPFDCAVCGACVYGKNSGIRTCLPCKSFFRRHAFLPPNVSKPLTTKSFFFYNSLFIYF
jgi:hypothetical protein